MLRILRAGVASLALLALASGAFAQGWRGQGRMAGKVTDEAGKPLAGVTVKAFLPEANGGTEVKTNSRGEWVLGGVAGGTWQLDFTKQGYEPRRISVPVGEISRIPPIEIVMKTAAPDPNQIIAAELQRASALVKERKFADAQAIYADLQLKYPQAYQIEIQIARAYDAEGAYDKEIEHLKKYLEKDPNNAAVKLLAGGIMIAKGNVDEGKQLLATVDDAQVTDPAIFVNVGINLLNQNKPKDAMVFFDKAVSRFPDDPDGYYYRGVTEVNLGAELRPDDKAASDKLIEAGKADLRKFIAMAPNAPEADLARKILEQLK